MNLGYRPSNWKANVRCAFIDTDLTRDDQEKGINMKDAIAQNYHPNMGAFQEEKQMSLMRHKKINDLAYELKAVMDSKMPDLKSHELCMLGDIMQRIGHLK